MESRLEIQLEFDMGLQPIKEARPTARIEQKEEQYCNPSQLWLPLYEISERATQYEMDKLGVYW